jgi:hypothetical protein
VCSVCCRMQYVCWCIQCRQRAYNVQADSARSTSRLWHCGVIPVWPMSLHWRFGPISKPQWLHSHKFSDVLLVESSYLVPVPPAPSSPTTLVNQSQRASVKATGSLLHTTTRYPLTATRYLCVRVLRKAPQPTPTKRFLRPPLPSSSFLRCRLT